MEQFLREGQRDRESRGTQVCRPDGSRDSSRRPRPLDQKDYGIPGPEEAQWGRPRIVSRTGGSK